MEGVGCCQGGPISPSSPHVSGQQGLGLPQKSEPGQVFLEARFSDPLRTPTCHALLLYPGATHLAQSDPASSAGKPPETDPPTPPPPPPPQLLPGSHQVGEVSSTPATADTTLSCGPGALGPVGPQPSGSSLHPRLRKLLPRAGPQQSSLYRFRSLPG